MKSKLFMLVLVVIALTMGSLTAGAVESVPKIATDDTTVDTSSWVVFDDTWYKCVGIRAYAKKPFRYRVFDRNGTSNVSGGLAPVDTTVMHGAITAGAVEYPVIMTLDVLMDSIRFVPSSGDSIFYHVQYGR